MSSQTDICLFAQGCQAISILIISGMGAMAVTATIRIRRRRRDNKATMALPAMQEIHCSD